MPCSPPWIDRLALYYGLLGEHKLPLVAKLLRVLLRQPRWRESAAGFLYPLAISLYEQFPYRLPGEGFLFDLASGGTGVVRLPYIAPVGKFGASSDRSVQDRLFLPS